MMVLAPALFSTRTVAPVRASSSRPTARTNTSIAPPGGSGTMKRIGREGYLSCAKAAGDAMPSEAARQASVTDRRRSDILDSFPGAAGFACSFVRSFPPCPDFARKRCGIEARGGRDDSLRRPLNREGRRVIFHPVADAALDRGPVGAGRRRHLDHRAMALLGVGHHLDRDAA